MSKATRNFLLLAFVLALVGLIAHFGIGAKESVEETVSFVAFAVASYFADRLSDIEEKLGALTEELKERNSETD
jgi:hypothetical protein